MFRRTLNVQVSQNVISSRFWATLNLKEIWTHLFCKFSPPPPPKKLFRCPCPRFRHLLWDIRTFRFWQSHMLEYSNTFSFLAPSECNQYKILNDSDRHSDFGRGDRKCDKNLTEDWYRFSAGAGTSIPTHCLRTIDVERTCLGGWTEHTQQLMKESFPEKFVLVAIKTVVTATLWSTYRIAALSLYTDWNRSKFVPADTAEKARGWNTDLVFKDIVYHYTLIFSRLRLCNLPLN